LTSDRKKGGRGKKRKTLALGGKENDQKKVRDMFTLGARLILRVGKGKRSGGGGRTKGRKQKKREVNKREEESTGRSGPVPWGK